MEEKRYWFAPGTFGRARLLDWRGVVAFGALAAVLICATAAEERLRAGHVVLFAFTMAALAGIAFALALVIMLKTKPAKETEKP